ncbi:serine/threonine protein phosphatase PrpC [Polaromonas sp. CG_9.5]|uniref:PP2C family protein-serine/threonine phosphatase n=1 Tax=Polaromonas sp. CG_9.5 TaxID=3071705 RepID=UPI002DFA1D9E|nr:serine/threonine protein phosphatase PrpC [Polaromonas sp. CG_9.5]
MKFSVFQLTRIGGRALNEDRMGYCYTRASCLLVLADGMGGHPEGEVAAQLTLETICGLYQQEAKPSIKNPAEFLSAALLAAHHRILRHATEKGMLDTPRTTLVAAILQDGHVTWLHCGDSRLYVVREGEMLLRTRDHSFLEQANDGFLKFEPVNRNILFTCLGSSAKPFFDMPDPLPLLQGDKLLLCSDGLWGSLDDAEIVRRLSCKNVAECVPEMVESALRKGGEHSDNVTALALEWETPNSFEATAHSMADSTMSGGFASTLQSGLPDSMGDDLDEAAIERSIAEINEAIRRSAAKKI